LDEINLVGNTRGAKQDAIATIATAVERLFAKLYKEPELSTRSVLETADAALELMAEICSNPVEIMSANPALRILVVDDDPVSRRAMSNALQLKFGKPECAESGSAALSLACQKTYDLIFMDVRMPGIDGFTACSEIRQITANRSTPVVFITTLSDIESQATCSLSGGSAFISKPVFPAQITLAALTFALRGRFDKLRNAAAPHKAVIS